MAFLKQAIFSLGLMLASGTYAKANEPDFQRIMETTKIAAKKVAAMKEDQTTQESQPNQTREEKFVPWLILETTIGGDASLSYKLPEGVKLLLDGTDIYVKGYGLSWKFGEDEFYYHGFSVDEYLESLYGEQPMENIKINDNTLSELLQAYEKEKDVLKSGLNKNLDQLQHDFLDIYEEKYSRDFTVEFIQYLIKILPKYGVDDGQLTAVEYQQIWSELEQFLMDFYGNKVDEEDKQKTTEAINTFLDNIDEVFKYTTIDDAIESAIKDPWKNISIGDKTLLKLSEFLEGFGNFMDVEISPLGMKAKGILEGQGITHTELSAAYKVKFGRKKAEFNHALSLDQGVYLKAFADIDFNMEKGAPIYIYITDEGIKISLEQLGTLIGFDFHLLDANLDASVGYGYQAKDRFSEFFQLSEPTSNGKKGVGVLTDKKGWIYQLMQINLDLKLDTWARTLTGNFSEDLLLGYGNHDNVLFYLFDEGEQKQVWHYAMIGAEYYDEKIYHGRQQIRSNFTLHLDKPSEGKTDSKGHKTYEPRKGVRPKINIAAGHKGKLLNPFFGYLTSPEEILKLGMLVDVSHITTRFSVRSASDEERVFNSSLRDEDKFLLETALTLFDDTGDKKTMSYYIKSEQLDASPKIGKTIDHQNVMTRYYSELDGLLVTAKIENSDYRIRALWATNSSLFVGTGYFGNTAEQMHGGEVVFGFDKFSLIGRYGQSQKGKTYGKSVKLSAVGTLDEIAIYLDLHGLLTAVPKEYYYEKYIYGNQITTSLNIVGSFDETNLIK